MFNLVPFERRQQNDLRRMFDDFEKNFFGLSDNFAGFSTDIVDQGDHYLLKADLPGFVKEDIAVDIDGDRLNISAQRNAEHEEKKENFVRRERSYGSFCRSFDISGIRAKDIRAEYKNGVLSLTLPKDGSQPEKSRRIEIE